MESDGVYFLVKGSFIVYYKDPDNLVQYLGPGDYFGDCCLIDKRSHVTYQATSDSVCLFVESQAVKSILQMEYFDQLFLKRLTKFRMKFIHGLTRGFASQKVLKEQDTEEGGGAPGMTFDLSNLLNPTLLKAVESDQPKQKTPKHNRKAQVGLQAAELKSVLGLIPKGMVRNGARYHSRLEQEDLYKEASPEAPSRPRIEIGGPGLGGMLKGLFNNRQAPEAPDQRTPAEAFPNENSLEVHHFDKTRRQEDNKAMKVKARLGSNEHSFQSSSSQARLNPSTPMKEETILFHRAEAVGKETDQQETNLINAPASSHNLETHFNNGKVGQGDVKKGTKSPYRQSLGDHSKASVPYIPESEIALNKAELKNKQSHQKGPIEHLRKAVMAPKENSRKQSKVSHGLFAPPSS